MALRDDIISNVGGQLPPSPILVSTPDLPKWDGQIFVRRVSSGVIRNLYRSLADDDTIDERALFAAWMACDQSGNRIFNDGDLLWLSQTPAMLPTIERIYAGGCSVNGLTAENREGWKKNSDSTAGTGSPCSSAAPSTPATGSTTSGS